MTATGREPETILEHSIEVEDLGKAFGSLWALRDVELQLRKGQVMAVFGPNGSGKTTLIRVLAALARPNRGSAAVEGHDIRREAQAVRRVVGVVTHQPLLYDDLTPYENLTFYGRMYGVHNLKEKVPSVLKRVGMESRMHDRVRTLSHGMQKRAALARAILHDPQVLLLDEPESGLDPEGVLRLHEIVLELKSQGKSVLMTTHNVEQGLALADEVVVIKQGQVVLRQAKAMLDVENFRATLAELMGPRP